MQDGGNKPACRAGHRAAAFRHDGDVAKTFRHHHFLVELMDALADFHEIQRFFFRTIGDAEAAAKIDELDMDAEPLLEFAGQRKHELCCEQEGFGAALIGSDHGVKAETAHAFFLCHPIGFEELVAGQSVFRFGRLADDVVAFHEVAGVVTEAEDLWQTGVLFEVVQMGNVVEIDDGAEFDGLLKFIGRRIVGSQQNLFPFDARVIGDQKLRLAAAVGAGSFFMQDLDDARIRQGLDGELLAESRRPGERLLQRADVLPNGMFIVNMKRRGVFFYDFLQLGMGKRE